MGARSPTYWSHSARVRLRPASWHAPSIQRAGRGPRPRSLADGGGDLQSVAPDGRSVGWFVEVDGVAELCAGGNVVDAQVGVVADDHHAPTVVVEGEAGDWSGRTAPKLW